jgi:YD repeat-containing protein
VTGRLTARHQVHTDIQAEGRAEVAVTVAPGPVVPIVSLAQANPGTTIDRSGCVRASIGAGAEYECGELRLGHPLPATRTLNRTRAPMLTYNWAHGHVRKRVQMDVRVPAGATVPDSVSVNFSSTLNGTNYVDRGTWTWPGSNWTSGAVRRLTVHSVSGWGTGIYPYRIEVTNWYQSVPYRQTVSDTMAIVNRTASRFRTGWWLAGLEELHVSSMLWVGGDGSTRRYRPAGTDVWKTDAYTRPDSIRRVGGMYHRHLPDGSRVVFDTIGRHVQTVNRLGHVTDFEYRAAGSRVLRYLRLPTASGARPFYEFHYTSDSLLWKVTAPPLAAQTRETVLAWDAGARELTVTDPDAEAVVFRYHATAGMILWRTDRRGALTSYGYNRGAMVNARIHMTGTGASSADIVTGFIPAETRGFIGNPAVDPAVAYTRILGPRSMADTTLIWVNRWGAPTRIRDALGNETRVFRENATYPALVTRTIAPNGLVSTAHHDAFARLDSAVVHNGLGDGRRAVTRYRYADTLWVNLPTHVISPERDSVVVTYDALGRRETIQPGPDTARRVVFTYNPSNHSTAPGLVHSVQSPLVDAEVYGYDARGNLSSVGTPSRVKVSYLNDGIGRPVRTRTYLNTALTQFQRDTAIYSIMDRVLETRSWGPEMNGALPQTLWVRNQYDEEGNLRFVRRWSDPDPAQIDTIMTEWRYDRANRALVEVAPDGQRDSTVYDAAGNVREVHTRRGHLIEMEYDLLNRLTKRRVPQATYGPRSDGIPTARYDLLATDNPPYPMYKSPNGGLVIAADSSMFGYDITGGILTADNADARVARAYYPNGLVRTETQRIRPVDGADWNKHVYQLAYAYDRNGRRAGVRHPAQLGPVASGNDWTAYGYHPETGALSTVVDPLHNAFGYEYRADGSLWKLTRPGGIVETLTYDNEGRLQTNVVQNGSNSPYRYHGAQFRNTTFTYDLRGKLLSSGNSVSFTDTLTSQYSGLGHVVSGGMKSRGFTAGDTIPVYYTSGETFSLDALGNYQQFDTWSNVNVGTTNQYTPRTRTSSYVHNVGRLARAASTSQVDTFFYDAAGEQGVQPAGDGLPPGGPRILLRRRRDVTRCGLPDGDIRGVA